MDWHPSEKMIASFWGLGQKSSVVIPTLFLFTVLNCYIQHGHSVGIAEKMAKIPCPPAFPSMDQIFKKSLLFPDLREILDKFKANASEPYSCTYSEETYDKIPEFNTQRCSRKKFLELVCPVTTVPVPSTTVIVTTTQRTTKSSTTIPAFTTSPTVKIVRTTAGVPRISTKISVSGTSIKPTTPGIKDKSTPAATSTGTVSSVNVTSAAILPATGRSTQSDDPRTIIICIFSGVIVTLVFLIVCFICRRRLHALPAKGPAVDVGKKNRKRSDRRPLRSISVQDGSEPGYLENGVGIMQQKIEIEGNSNYSKEYVKNGTKWRPGYDQPSETSSQASGSVRSTGHYMLLREDSNISAMSLTDDSVLHFNTLRTLDYPHALYLGGFGESSTDLTLPRNRHRLKVEEEQRRKQKEQSQILQQQVGDGKVRVKNKDLPEMETSFCDKINMFENLHNGQPNGDVKSKSNGQVIMREKPKDQSKENHAYDNKGLDLKDESPGSRSGDCSSRASMDTLLKANMVLDNLDGHLENQDNSYVHTWAAKLSPKPPDDEETASTLSKKSQTSVLEPPDEFRDNEPPLAIVSPSVHNPGKSWQNSNNEYSPQNSYLRNHVGQGSPLNQSPASTTQRTLKSDHGSSSEASTLQSRSSTFDKNPNNNTFLYNVNWSKPPGDKPSAHVQPQPQMPETEVEELSTKL